MSEQLKVRIDTTTTSGYVYIGESLPSVLTSAAYWRIKKVDASTGDTDWAGGVNTFSQVWDNRASLSYS